MCDVDMLSVDPSLSLINTHPAPAASLERSVAVAAVEK